MSSRSHEAARLPKTAPIAMAIPRSQGPRQQCLHYRQRCPAKVPDTLYGHFVRTLCTANACAFSPSDIVTDVSETNRRGLDRGGSHFNPLARAKAWSAACNGSHRMDTTPPHDRWLRRPAKLDVPGVGARRRRIERALDATVHRYRATCLAATCGSALVQRPLVALQAAPSGLSGCASRCPQRQPSTFARAQGART